jgi:hypothetical protein
VTAIVVVTVPTAIAILLAPIIIFVASGRDTVLARAGGDDYFI